MIDQGEYNILVATVMWRRHDLFRKFAHHYKKLGFDVLAVGSEGQVSKELCERMGCAYLEMPNSPFMVKLNSRVDYFLEHEEYTHVLFVGSDDFLDENALNYQIKHLEKYDVVSWSDMYVFCAQTNQILYATGYTNKRKGEPYAPGRCMSRKAINDLDGMLWINPSNKVALWPDAFLWSKLRYYEPKISLRASDVDGFLVDVKTGFNKHSFQKVKRNARRNGTKILSNRLDLARRFSKLLEDYE